LLLVLIVARAIGRFSLFVPNVTSKPITSGYKSKYLDPVQKKESLLETHAFAIPELSTVLLY
jgi:hypothetical protein